MADELLAGLRGRLFGRGADMTGQEITVEVLSGPWHGAYETRVTGADTERLFLATPVSDGRPVRPEPGTAVRAMFRNHSGSYCFVGTVVTDELKHGHCMVITMPAEIRRLQRRGHVRLPASIPVQVMRLPRPGEPDSRVPSFLRGMTRDLAAGGLSFTCTGLEVTQGDIVSVLIMIPEAARRIQATCEVVRPAEPDGAVAVTFVDVDERAREELGAFVARASRRARASALSARLRELEGQ